MTDALAARPGPSARQAELLELAYRYLLTRGRAELSLRPLASAIGSSPRVLLYLFGSKDGLIRALLARARAGELALLSQASSRPATGGAPAAGGAGLADVGARIWAWLSDERHQGLLNLWVDSYARSLTDPEGPWAGFAAATVTDWLSVLAAAQSSGHRDTPDGQAERALLLAVLRGALLDLLATGDVARTTAAVTRHLATLPDPHSPAPPGPRRATPPAS